MARPTGARPSPRHKLVSAPRHVPRAVPASFGVIPPQLSYWGNSQYGDCVSAEEAYAKAIYAIMSGQPELFVPEANVISWAHQNGYLNGANLTDVMDSMAKSGMVASDGKAYTDGPYQAVDWTDDAVLSSAIYAGPVKIGVSSGQLQNVVGTANGWVLTGASQDQNEDHCVVLCGFGAMEVLCGMLNVPVPSGVNPTARGYLLGTWDTVGIIDQPSMINITGEAWLRTPTTPGTPGPAPNPQPTPTPVPVPGPTPPPVPPTPVPVPMPPAPALFTGTFETGHGPFSPPSTITVVNGLITGKNP